MSWGDKTYEERRSSIVYHNRCHSGSREFISSSTRPTYRRYSWVFFFYFIVSLDYFSIFHFYLCLRRVIHMASLPSQCLQMYSFPVNSSNCSEHPQVDQILLFYIDSLPFKTLLIPFRFLLLENGGGGQDFHVAFNFFFQESKIEFNLFFSHFGFYYQLIYSTKYVCPNLIF